MCGLTGFLGGAIARSENEARRVTRAMAGELAHRGPDSAGFWHDADAAIALGHTRLAIVELSPAGAQPMQSHSGRYVLSFNGEIYNHADLRAELEQQGSAPNWRGNSDTETLVAAIEAWGVAATLERAIGMFAFALWDRRDRTLTLARDRLGEKPLYYGWVGNGASRSFVFGSELKSLTAHPAFSADIDRAALTEFLRFGYVPAPLSIYRGVSKLPPGTLATIRLDRPEPQIEAYWTVRQAVNDGQRTPFGGSPQEAVDALETLLLDAVGKQMMADVPLGAFLSGGIDSSTIVALMQVQSTRPVQTFSIGFHEDGYNEADQAKAVAAHLGTQHTELYVTAEEACAVIPALPTIYDEPFADASQIPTHLVSRLARSQVAVSLSGDAGDELFCGYSRYGLTDRVWRRLASIPTPARAAIASALTRISPTAWNRMARIGGAGIPALRRLPNPGRKIHKGAGVLASRSASELYRGIVSHWVHPEHLVVGAEAIEPAEWASEFWNTQLSDVEKMMATDLVTYLPDDILAKVDRAAMAVSLETRVPMLDHRVVEFAWSLPMEYKLRGGRTKWVLRELLNRHVPSTLTERPKMGFGLPIDSWLRGPLREWAEELLDPRLLREQGLINPDLVREAWQTHQSGAANVEYQLWDVLMFQAWFSDASAQAPDTNLLLKSA